MEIESKGKRGREKESLGIRTGYCGDDSSGIERED